MDTRLVFLYLWVFSADTNVRVHMYVHTYTYVFTARAKDIREERTKGNGPAIREGFEKYANAYRANGYRKSTDWAFAESLLMEKKYRRPFVGWTITGEISFGLFHHPSECKFRANPSVTGSFVQETLDENKRITARMKISSFFFGEMKTRLHGRFKQAALFQCSLLFQFLTRIFLL